MPSNSGDSSNILLLEKQLARHKESLLYSEELTAAKSLISALKTDTALSLTPVEFLESTKLFLETRLPLREYMEIKAEAYAEARERISQDDDAAIRPDILFSRSKPWHLMLTQEFIDGIAKLDKKLQGRVLEAITKIVISPVEPLGDTIKPLSGDMKGMWRYRIGDYRLVYNPNQDDMLINLISFEPRGDIYH